MKKICFLFLGLIMSFLSYAQNEVKWNVSVEPAAPTVGENAKLVFTANIKSGYHIYGTEDGCNGMGPLLTVLTTTGSSGFKAAGSLKAIGFHRHKDEAFDCEVVDKEGVARFELPIIVESESIVAKGQLDFMVCQQGMCIPLDHVFSQSFKASAGKKKNEELNSITKPLEIEKGKTDLDASIDTISSSKVDLSTPIDNKNTDCKIQRKAGWDDISIIRYEQAEVQNSLKDYIWFILGAFLAGLITVVTPCVFPMLPMTVSFFTKSNQSRSAAIRQALIYGFSIVFIYTLFGVVVGKLFGEEFTYWLSTNAVVNLVFFAIFIVFALSFLGMFEITLPSGFVNSVDAKADKGGFVGTFFMALTLVLVSFSCTGPIVGSIMVLAANGDLLLPSITMLSFAIAFALPFTLFAIFPSFIQKLPKSGGWLNSVKVVLGLVELALSLKFLSQADQVQGWGILDREVFLAIWICLFIIIALYLFGKIRFPHDSETHQISVPRSVLAMSSLAFAIYLLPGLWCAPLKSLSGLLPPMSTQDYPCETCADNSGHSNKAMYSDQLHIAHGINGYFDVREGFCTGIESKKPIFIDFTGKTCANCRLVEQKVWSDEKVQNHLKNDFVLVSLYTDYNKIELPQSEHYTSSNGREITTLGKSLQDFEKLNYNTLSLPTYSIIMYDEEESFKQNKHVFRELAPTQSYTGEVDEYLKFIETGLTNFKNAIR